MIGQRIADGKYEVVRLLGEGGMGAVVQARQVAMNRMVAIKLIRGDMGVRPDAVTRFLHEMKVTARIEHPNTIRLYDFGEDQGQLYLAMELLDGDTLGHVIDGAGKLDLPRIVRIGRQVANALGAIHRHGVVHRDLKPDNVMLIDAVGERDFVKVLDFGIAKSLDDDSNLTGTGRPIGTPAYMSPEQALGQPVDHRTDLYALGVMLYRMASGRAPFDAPSAMSMLLAHASALPPPIHTVVPEASPALGALIMQLLEKDPAARPQSAAEVVTRLDRCLHDVASIGALPTLGMTAPQPLPRRVPWLPIAAGAIVVAGALTAFAIVRGAPGHTVATAARPADAKPADAPRIELDALLGAREPLAPEACRAHDAATVERLTQAARALGVPGTTGEPAQALVVLGASPGPSAEAWLLVSRAQLARDTDAAERAAAEAVRLCPGFAAAHNAAGNALQKLGRATDAEDAYVRALTAAPSYDAPRFNLGLLQLRARDASAAVATFTELLHRRPDHPNAHFARAQALAAQGKDDAALVDLDEAVRRQPNNADAWAVLGEVRERLHRADAQAAYCTAKQLGHAKAGERCPQ